MLRLVAGLERPDRGTVTIGGRDVTRAPPAARDVAFVFQQYSLYPHLSVYDNLAFPLRSPARRFPEDEIRQRVTDSPRSCTSKEARQPRHPTFGRRDAARRHRPRAGARPQVYLMDEPLSSLDAKLRAELRIELKRIQMELGATILYVTHDQIEAMTMATRIGVLNEGAAAAARLAARGLRAAEQHLCRRAARHAADQPAAGRALPDLARRAARPRSACAPNIS